MMKTSRLLLALACTGCYVTTVQAVPPVNAGHLYFSGDISAISCIAGARADNGNSVLDMGSIGFDDIGTIASPKLLLANRINIRVTCPDGSSGMDTVHMTFRPTTGGTGLDPVEPRLLANTGSATGVGVAIIKDDDTLLDFNSLEPLNATMTEVAESGVATLTLRAAYVRNGAALGVGNLVSSTPFLLTYE